LAGNWCYLCLRASSYHRVCLCILLHCAHGFLLRLSVLLESCL
jgi:hypothetical protein